MSFEKHFENIASVLDEIEDRLRRVGVPDPRVDAEFLIEHISGIRRLELPLFYKKKLNDHDRAGLESLVSLREKRIPLQHLLGTISFLGHTIHVSSEALIPRPETEQLAEVAIEMLQKKMKMMMQKKMQSMMQSMMQKKGYSTYALELGTGTACLAVALCKAAAGLKILALEVSSKALRLASENVRFHNLQKRIRLLKSDGFASLQKGSLFDLIISNPPYIPTDERQTLQAEVRDHEPQIALDGGKDGLDFYRKIAEEGRTYLREKGVLCLEFGDGQKDHIQEIFESKKWFCIDCHSDLSNRPRVFVFRLS